MVSTTEHSHDMMCIAFPGEYFQKMIAYTSDCFTFLNVEILFHVPARPFPHFPRKLHKISIAYHDFKKSLYTLS